MIANDSLYHHGILGQRWGIRRFQNKDGTRTTAGKKRYSGKSDDGLISFRDYLKTIDRDRPEDSPERKNMKRELRKVKAQKLALGLATGTSVTALGYAAVGSVLTAGTATVPLMAATGASAIAGRAAYSKLSKKQYNLMWDLL